MREFRVNKNITLKLENNKTLIYVNGEQFNQCKYLLLNITLNEIKDLLAMESVDQLAENLDSSLEGKKQQKFKIPSETEFWAHCSNIQVWYENNYDTCLLHRNLAFPLLYRLADVGDLTAKRVLKEEIAKRFLSGNISVMLYLKNENYLNILSKEEYNTLLQDFYNKSKAFYSKMRENEKPQELLHLLKISTKAGIPKAKEILLEEIVKVFETDNLPMILYLINNAYISYLIENNIFINKLSSNPKLKNYLLENLNGEYEIKNKNRFKYVFNDEDIILNRKITKSLSYLKILSMAGDYLAESILKKEIIKALNSKSLKIIEFLVDRDFLECISRYDFELNLFDVYPELEKKIFSAKNRVYPFEFLHKLVCFGDPSAMRILKERIIRQITGGCIDVIYYLTKYNLLNYIEENGCTKGLLDIYPDFKNILLKNYENKKIYYLLQKLAENNDPTAKEILDEI
ncbi:MAG: hypothetical protein ACFFAN_21045 [Promethearchaeota archaeon]